MSVQQEVMRPQGVIDLTTHRNNIRLKPEPVQAVVQAIEDKKKTKCKYFPNCRETEETCPYHHPT